LLQIAIGLPGGLIGFPLLQQLRHLIDWTRRMGRQIKGRTAQCHGPGET
jgi:hypothetical protein